MSVNFNYKFIFKDGKEKSFDIRLAPDSLNYIPQGDRDIKPDWARLSFNRCGNCPLDEKKIEYCPVALNLVDFLDTFKDIVSYETAKVVIESNLRVFSKEVSVQESISSMLGVYMVTGGCPVMAKLKPMVRFHLPFSNMEETIFRTTSIYLLGQYFLNKRGKKADWKLKGLADFYNQVFLINQGMLKRFKGISGEDAVANALIRLGASSRIVPFYIDHDLKEIEYLFSAYYG